jgi:hypothetical protein
MLSVYITGVDLLPSVSLESLLRNLDLVVKIHRCIYLFLNVRLYCYFGMLCLCISAALLRNFMHLLYLFCSFQILKVINDEVRSLLC